MSEQTLSSRADDFSSGEASMDRAPEGGAPTGAWTAEHLRGRCVLVTGATGFVGRHLCRALSESGVDVLGVARKVAEAPAVDGVRWASLDVTDAAACSELVAVERPETVFHLASHVAGARDVDLVLPMLRANLLGTVHLLQAVEAARRAGHGGRLIQVGSQEQPRGPGDVPPSPYAAAKAAALPYCQLFASLYGVSVGLARVFMVYGPGPQDEKKLVPYVIRSLEQGDEPQLMSGARRVDWVHVRDVVEGLIALDAALAQRTDADEASLLEVDLGTGKLTAVSDLVAELYCQMAPGRQPTFGAVADRAGEVEPVADVDSTAERIGWRARVALEEGLADTVAGLLERG